MDEVCPSELTAAALTHRVSTIAVLLGTRKWLKINQTSTFTGRIGSTFVKREALSDGDSICLY